ncbi:MAG: hypothetical protein AAGJ93_14650, partial [Bacteroidota bacterium]
PTMRSTIILSIILLFSSLAKAQIGKDFGQFEYNGPIKRVVNYQFTETEQNAAGEYIGIGYPSKTTITYKDDFPALLEYEMRWGDQGEYQRNSKIEIDWQNGNIMQVRHYSDMESRSGRIFKSYQPLYKDGKMIVENILYSENELRASIVYDYPPTEEEGLKILDMTVYKPDKDGPQGHFYFEYDQWGKRTHIESVGQDTGMFSQRIRMEGDSIFETINIVASRRTRGTKDTAIIRTTHRYDEYKNTVWQLMEIEKTSGEPEPPVHMLLITAFDYEGRESTTQKAFSTEQIVGRWVNSKRDLSLTLGLSPNSQTAGIFSTGTINQDALDIMIESEIEEDRIADTGDSWIIALTKSGIGEWEYDPNTEMITFRQRDHVIAKVKLSVDLFSLTLKPEKEWVNALLLQKR